MANKLRTINKNTVTAGTAVALTASDIVVSEFSILAKKGNTGIIYVGDSTVTNSTSTSVGGYPLAANESLGLGNLKDADGRVNLKDIYLNSSVDGEGVHVIYVQRNQSF